MNIEATPPIFVIDESDCGVFRSIEDAVLNLEPIDVQRDEYRVYDSLGYRLEAIADGRSVRIYMPENPVLDVDRLRACLKQLVERTQGKVLDDSVSLNALVKESLVFVWTPPRWFRRGDGK